MGLNTTLNARPRQVDACPAGRLRAQGLLPAIFYGKELSEAQSLILDYSEFKKAFLNDDGNRSLYTLVIEGQASFLALLKDYQIDPVSRRMLHVDFMKIDPQKPISVKVPIRLVGKPAGVEKGGQLQQSQREITVSGLPREIPSIIEADVAHLGLGQTMHLSQVKLPSELTLVKTVDLPVAVVGISKGAKGEAEEAVVAAPVAPAAPEKKK